MDLTESQVREIEEALERLQALDPAEVPEPASQLADLLGSILDQIDEG
jgi:hypothetical protein